MILAHVVVRHDLVAAGLEQRADLVVGRRRRNLRGGGCRAGAAAAPSGPCPLFACLDIARDHAAMRPGALDAREINAASFASRRASGEENARPC